MSAAETFAQSAVLKHYLRGGYTLSDRSKLFLSPSEKGSTLKGKTASKVFYKGKEFALLGNFFFFSF